jgi:hypothetical protein
LKIAFWRAPAFTSSASSTLASGVVGTNKEVPYDRVVHVSLRGYRDHRGEASTVFSDVGQLIDVFDSARSFEDERFESGSELQFRARCSALSRAQSLPRGRRCRRE